MVSFLAELLLDTFASVFDPDSDRAVVASFSIVSAIIAAVDLWLLMAMSNPIGPNWSGLVVLAGLLSGIPGLLLSYLHFVRNDVDRVFASLCLVANGAAVSLSVFAIVAR